MREDFQARLKPLGLVMREHRITRLQMSQENLSHQAGKGDTWLNELESGKGIQNPSLSRLVAWARAVQAQEFGLYVVLHNAFTDVPLLDGDEQ